MAETFPRLVGEEDKVLRISLGGIESLVDSFKLERIGEAVFRDVDSERLSIKFPKETHIVEYSLIGTENRSFVGKVDAYLKQHEQFLANIDKYRPENGSILPATIRGILYKKSTV